MDDISFEEIFNTKEVLSHVLGLYLNTSEYITCLRDIWSAHNIKNLIDIFGEDKFVRCEYKTFCFIGIMNDRETIHLKIKVKFKKKKNITI